MRSGQGTDTYVDDTRYDAAGRVTLRELGTNYTLGQSYTYYPWTQQGGRLQSMQSGIPADQDSLQSLSYVYDDVGNVQSITDYNAGGTQTQAFTYDDLDRLSSAVASGGTGGTYPLQSYDYDDDTGNMETNAGMDYTYTYPNAPAGVAPEHGVRQVTGGIGYNGMVTIRAKRGTGCTTSPEMKLYINGTLREQWTVNKTSYWNYTKNTGMTTDAQVDVVFTNAYSGCTLQVDYVTIPTATGTRTVQAESAGTIFDRGAETGAPGANAFDGVNVLNGAELMSENGSLRFVVGLNALAAGYDANGNMTLRLKDGARYFLAYDAENRLTSVSGTVSASFAYNGDGQRVSATIDTTITTYIGGYFEWQGGAGTSYYFAGAQRIAMRTGTDVKYLLGDHLGSTSVTALTSGAFDTETRYYPWGGVRWSSGASPTDYMFTGQQEIPTIGLYFYNSRFYDAALGRFISPDTIIPNPGDPVSYDRFSYVRNNPVKYVDPSGHWACGDYYDPGCVETFAEAGAMMRATGMNVMEGGKRTFPMVAREDWGQYAPGDNPGNFSDENRETFDPNDQVGGYYEYKDSLADELDTFVIHHVGGENNQGNDPSIIETASMHDKGLYDVPYHFIIGFDGTIYEGRDIGARGAHVLGGNSGKIGVILLGNFNDISPTQNQLDAALGLLLYLDAAYGIDEVGGHSRYNETDCPGTNFPVVFQQWEEYIK